MERRRDNMANRKSASGEDSMQRLTLIVCATFLICLGNWPGFAEMRLAQVSGSSGICMAKTCSGARAGCVRRCTGTRRCDWCDSEFQGCLQTGAFNGRVCQLSGLTRR
jgi:hypothetical protein